MPVRRTKKKSHFGTFKNQYVQLLGEFTTPAYGGDIATVNGYLIDTDKDFFYLGASLEKIDSAVKINRVFSVQLMEKQNREKQYLTQWPIPEDKSGAN